MSLCTLMWMCVYSRGLPSSHPVWRVQLHLCGWITWICLAVFPGVQGRKNLPYFPSGRPCLSLQHLEGCCVSCSPALGSEMRWSKTRQWVFHLMSHRFHSVAIPESSIGSFTGRERTSTPSSSFSWVSLVCDQTILPCQVKLNMTKGTFRIIVLWVWVGAIFSLRSFHLRAKSCRFFVLNLQGLLCVRYFSLSLWFRRRLFCKSWHFQCDWSDRWHLRVIVYHGSITFSLTEVKC